MEFKTLRPLFKQSFNFILLAVMSFNTLANDVNLVSGFIRLLPATVPNTAAYLTLENHGKAKQIIAAETPVAQEAQLHTLIEEKGLIKMREVTSYALPSHGQLILEPTGNHIMILGLKKPLLENQQVPLTLIFADQTKLNISLPVKKGNNNADTKHNHHHHHHH
ncbi:MAG: copper chaperone PCu(A)C [Parashewanella sp.]